MMTAVTPMMMPGKMVVMMVVMVLTVMLLPLSSDNDVSVLMMMLIAMALMLACFRSGEGVFWGIWTACFNMCFAWIRLAHFVLGSYVFKHQCMRI